MSPRSGRDAEYPIAVPIEYVAQWGHRDVVALLLDRGAALGHALERAAGMKHRAVTELLVRRGAPVTAEVRAAPQA